jgi:serine/threonine protein kinase
LGKGAYGYVWLVRRIGTEDLYAMKTITISDDISSDTKENLINERNIFKEVIGEHCVTALFSFIHERYICFVMEFMPGGDLKEYLSDEDMGGPLDDETAKNYTAELILAIESLHSKNIIHRDLKPDNILLDKNGHIKLADFGLSKLK